MLDGVAEDDRVDEGTAVETLEATSLVALAGLLSLFEDTVGIDVTTELIGSLTDSDTVVLSEITGVSDAVDISEAGAGEDSITLGSGPLEGVLVL